MSFKRPSISNGALEQTLDDLRKAIHRAIEKHGDGACVSLHEVRGMIEEERDEFAEEVHKNNIPGARSEALDIAIAAVWGAASIKDGHITEEWMPDERKLSTA